MGAESGQRGGAPAVVLMAAALQLLLLLLLQMLLLRLLRSLLRVTGIAGRRAGRPKDGQEG